MFKSPKKDWCNGDGLITSDLNRIEGNIKHIKERQESLYSNEQVRTSAKVEMTNKIVAKAGLLSNQCQNIIILNRYPTAADGAVGDLCVVYKEV